MSGTALNSTVARHDGALLAGVTKQECYACIRQLSMGDVESVTETNEPLSVHASNTRLQGAEPRTALCCCFPTKAPALLRP